MITPLALSSTRFTKCELLSHQGMGRWVPVENHHPSQNWWFADQCHTLTSYWDFLRGSGSLGHQPASVMLSRIRLYPKEYTKMGAG